MLASKIQEFLSFHNRVEFGKILEGLRNFGGGGLNTPNPPRYATAAKSIKMSVLPRERNDVCHSPSYRATKHIVLPQTISTHLNLQARQLPDFYIWIFSREIFTVSTIKFHEDASSGSSVDTCGWRSHEALYATIRTRPKRRDLTHAVTASTSVLTHEGKLALFTPWQYRLNEGMAPRHSPSRHYKDISRQLPDVDGRPRQWPNERLVKSNKPGVA